MSLLSCFKALALVLLWKLDLFTCIESSSPVLHPTEKNPQFLSHYNDNNCNNRYRPGRYGHHSHRNTGYHVANRGKIPPEPPPPIHPRLRSRNYSDRRYTGYRQTHSLPGHSHHSTYEHDFKHSNFITLDISKAFPTHSYTISYERGMAIFTATPPYLFSKVKNGPELLWKYTGNGYPNMVTYREIYGKPNVEVHFPQPPRRSAGKYRPPGFLYTNPDFVGRPDPNYFRTKVPHMKPSRPIPGHGLLGFEHSAYRDRMLGRKHHPGTETGSSVLIPLNVDRFESTDTVKYRYDQRTGIHTLKAREPYLIDEVIQKGQTIWQAKNNRYGDRVILKYDENGKPKARVLYPDWAVFGMPPPPLSQDLDPRSEPSRLAPQFHGLSPSAPHTERKPKSSVPKDASAPIDQPELPTTASSYLPDTIDTSFPPPSSPHLKPSHKKPFELDINNRNSSDQFEYSSDVSTKTMTYVGKGVYRFSAVKYGGNVLWSTQNPTEYANKVTLTGYEHTGMFRLVLNLDGGDKTFFKTQSAPWTEVDTSKTKGVSINVLSNADTFYYTIHTAGKNKTFIAKDRFRFSKVRSGETEIWETNNIEEFSNKVVNEDNKRIVIYLDNDKLFTFVCGRRGCQGCKGLFCGLLSCGIYNCTGKRWKQAK